MPVLVQMIKDLTPAWRAQWIPSAARVLAISDTGLEIRRLKKKDNVDWTATNEHPEKAALWFLNMVTITTPSGTSRLVFGTAERRDAAWKALMRAWYIPRVHEFLPCRYQAWLSAIYPQGQYI